MPLDQLPVPDVTLQDSDKATTFKTKINILAAALKTAIQAFNSQIVAGNVAENSAVVAGQHKDAAAASATTAGQHKDAAALSATAAGQHKDAAAVSATTAGQHKDSASASATTAAQLKVAADAANSQAQQAAAIAVQYPTEGQLAAAMALREQFFRKCTLDLNFAENRYRVYEQYGLTDKVITDALTVVRASDAPYQGPVLMATAASHQPRISYNPINGDSRGLLCERSAINYLNNSRNFSVLTLENATVTSGFQSPVFGDAGASRFSIVADGGLTVRTTTIAGLPDIYSFSLYFKRETYFGELRLQINNAGSTGIFTRTNLNLDTMVRSSSSNGSGYSVISTELHELQDGWYRLVLNGTKNAGDSIQYRIILVNAAPAGQSILVDQRQLTNTPVAASPIVTGASQLTRAGDDISRALTQINTNEATLYCEFMCLGLASDGYRKAILKLNNADNTADRGFGIELSANNEIQVLMRDGTVNASITTPVIAATGVFYKVAIRYNNVTGTLSICVNGGTVMTVPKTALATAFLSHLFFQGSKPFTGSLGGNPTYYRRASLALRSVTDAEVQAITRQ